MKPGEVTEDIALKIMKIWGKHMGFYWDSDLYSDEAYLISEGLNNPRKWVTFPYYERRIGSRYTDDSKLRASLESSGELKIYGDINMGRPEDGHKEAFEAEDAFNKALSEYLLTL